MVRFFSHFSVAFLCLQLIQVDRASATSNRIVAVGDIHSDYKQALAVLQMAKVIDSKGDWIAGQDTFVQTVSPKQKNGGP